MRNLKKLQTRTKNRRSALVSLLLLSTMLGVVMTVPDAAAEDVRCTGGSGIHGWTFSIATSGHSGMIIKDVVFSGKYLIKWMNVPWFNLDTDSDLVRPGGATFVSCSTQTYGTYGTASLRMTTTSSSGYDGYSSQDFWFNFLFYPTGIMDARLVTSLGSGFQEHPYYIDVAPCSDCNYNDGGDDRMVFSNCYDCFSTYGGLSWQILEGNLDEPGHSFAQHLWVMVDQKINFGNTQYPNVFQVWAAYNAYDGGSAYRVQAWIVKCESCSDAAYSQYTNGPWDTANHEFFSQDGGNDFLFVTVHKRNTGSGGWESSQIIEVL